jgi:glycosyltransferase involved in cell wall biosynthesis
MRVLHLLSEWKWTGPSEPVVSLCEALREVGIDARIAFMRAPSIFPEKTVEKEVSLRGIPRCTSLSLNRYFSPKEWIRDMRHLRRYVSKEGIDVVHAHLTHDHILSVLSFLPSRERPILVRTDHKREGMRYGPFIAYVLSKTDGLILHSERLRRREVETFLFPEERTIAVPPGLERLSVPVRDVRRELGISDKEYVIAVAGRLKKDRFYHLVIEALHILRRRGQRVRLLVLGRSSQVQESIWRPARRFGVEEHIVFAGYRREDFASYLSSCNVFLMMRAGSDGSARALRQAMRLGKPAIVSNLGMLPEIVEDGVSGYVVELEAHEIAQRVEDLIKDEEKRRRFGEEARKRSLQWDYIQEAERVAEFYKRLKAIGRR